MIFRKIDRRKERTEESKLKQKQSIGKTREKNLEDQKQLSTMKAELIKQEYQDNMKEYLEQKLFDLVNKLKHVEKGSLSTIELKSLLTKKNIMGGTPKYNATELAILFDYYKQFIEQINKVQRYLPTKQNFCGFIGISSNIYDSYKQSDEDEKRELMQMIDDYILDLGLTSAQNGEIRELTTMFRAKSDHGHIEATAPVVIQHKSEIDMDKMLEQIEALKAGKSLKTIELKQNEDGSFG